MNQRVVVWTGFVFLAACGGGGDSRDPAKCASDGGEHCFQIPTAAMVSHFDDQELDTVIGCGPLEPALAATAVEMSGTIDDYSGGAGIGGATLTIYEDDALTQEVGTTTTADDGTYTMNIPAGTPDILHGVLEADGYVTLNAHNGRPDLTGATTEFNLVMASQELLDTIGSLVDVEIDPDLALIAGVLLDCDRNNIEHAAFVVSTTSGERDFVSGVNIFYGAAGGFPLPVPADVRVDSNDNGAVAVMNLPAVPVFLQVWGFPDEAAVGDGEDGLELVAEYELEPDAGESIGFNAFANQ